MTGFLEDLRFGFRVLVRNRGMAAVAILSLVLGMTGTVVIFAVAAEILFKPFPSPDAESLVRIGASENGSGFEPLSHFEYELIRQQRGGLEDVLAFRWNAAAVTSGDTPREESIEVVTPNYFSMLSVPILIGRGLLQADRNAAVAVLSYRHWRRLGSDSTLVGRTIRINGTMVDVVGVAGPKFAGAFPGFEVGLWVPLGMYETALPGDGQLDDPANRSLMLIARLAPGGGPDVQAELDVIANRLAIDDPDGYRTRRFRVEPATGVIPSITAIARPFLTLLFAVTVLVLLAACSNVANLLLARETARRPEIALRATCGASPFRIVRQLLTESLVLSGIAAAVTLAVSWAVLRLISRYRPPIDVPIVLDVRLNFAVLLFAAVIALGTGTLFLLLPAVRASRLDLAEALKKGRGGGGRRASQIRSAFVVSQIAISVTLLVATLAFVRSSSVLRSVDPGFDASGVLILEADPRPFRRGSEGAANFWQTLKDRASAIQGVDQVSLALFVPLGGQADQFRVAAAYVDGEDERRINYNAVDPDYLPFLDLSLEAGRNFGASDRAGAPPVAIVNDVLARSLGGASEAIGHILRFQRGATESSAEVVGVVRSIKYRQLGEGPTPFLYVPIAQHTRSDLRLHVRGPTLPSGGAATLLTVVRSLEPDLPVRIRPMTEVTRFSGTAGRIAAIVVGVSGAMGLVISAIGIFGVVSYTTAQRRREFGIRLAMGSSPAALVRRVVRRGLWPLVLGTVLGLALGIAVTGLLGRLLMGVGPTDPIVLGGGVALMFVVGLLATYLPARGALSVDPADVLRLD